jgi:hypothetical protein
MPLMDVNPLAGGGQAIMDGLNMRMALQNAARQQQQFEQEQGQRAHDASVKNIVDRMNLEMNGARPVVNGVVQDSMSNAPAPDGQGDPQASGGAMPQTSPSGSLDALRNAAQPAPQTPPQTAAPQASAGPYLRKADKSRLVTVSDPQGGKLDYELPTAQEQNTRLAMMQQASVMRDKMGLAAADTAAKQFVLKIRGQKLPDDKAQILGIDNSNPHSLFLPEEIPAMMAKAAEITKSNAEAKKAGFIDVAPGAGIASVDQLAPAQGATGAPAAGGGASAPAGSSPMVFQQPPPATDDFGKYFLPAYAAKAGKKVSELSPDENIKAFSDFTLSKADPEVRASMLAMRNSADAVRQLTLNQAPTQEQAAQVADDLINHRMAPEQSSSMFGGFGPSGQAFKRMVYGAAKKADPNFNFEQASAEYALAKSPGFQNTVRYMDSAMSSLPQLQNSANLLANGKVSSINSLINAGKKQFNSVDLKKFQTDKTLVGDEVAKILQGGGTGSGVSDAKLKQAQDIFRDSDDPKAIAASIGEVNSLLGYRRHALTRGTYMENAAPQASGKIMVHASDGKDHPFDTPEQAATFEAAVKKAGGTTTRQQ